MPISRRRTRRATLQHMYAHWAFEKGLDTDAFLTQFEDDRSIIDTKYFDEAQSYIHDNLPYLLGIIQHF